MNPVLMISLPFWGPRSNKPISQAAYSGHWRPGAWWARHPWNYRESCHELGEVRPSGGLESCCKGGTNLSTEVIRKMGSWLRPLIPLPVPPSMPSRRSKSKQVLQFPGLLGASVVSACKNICFCSRGPTPYPCLQPFLHVVVSWQSQ